jgi:Sec-independent protein translocase protein TatA
VHYILTAKYPKTKELIFPDSSFSYFPFEYLSRAYFSTTADSTFAFDSVIYELTSFEIDKIQQLDLPVFLLTSNDSIEIKTSPDSIYLTELIPVVYDSLELKANTSYFEVPFAINYPYITIGVGILLILALVVFLIFGKTIRKKLLIRKLKKDFEKFKASFGQGINEIKKHTGPQVTEHTVAVWKRYMERLENRPYTKLTTKEILASGLEDKLKDSLKGIDRNIYGSRDIQDLYRNFEVLEDFTQERYQRRINEVNNG